MSHKQVPWGSGLISCTTTCTWTSCLSAITNFLHMNTFNSIDFGEVSLIYSLLLWALKHQWTEILAFIELLSSHVQSPNIHVLPNLLDSVHCCAGPRSSHLTRTDCKFQGIFRACCQTQLLLFIHLKLWEDTQRSPYLLILSSSILLKLLVVLGFMWR